MAKAKAKKKPVKRKSAKKTRKRDINLNLRVTDEEREAFREAAEAAGVDLSTWIRLLLRDQAGMATPGQA